MNEQGLIEPFAAPEVFVDGFTEHAIVNGIFSCVGYRRLGEHRVAVLRIVLPANRLQDAISRALTAMTADPVAMMIAEGVARH